MRKTILPLIFSVAVLFSLVQQAKALTIQIDQNGQMSFLSGQVLGKDTEDDSKDEPEYENEQKDDDKDEDKDEQKQEDKKEPKHRDEVRETPKPEKKLSDKKPELKQVLKNISAKENKLLKIKNTREKTEVSVEAKTNKPTPEQRKEKRSSSDDIPEQEIESETVDIKLPANEKPERKGRPESEAKEINAAIEKIKRERSERRDALEIKSKTNDDGSNEFEIESGAIKAKLKSAEFTVDPATNEVKVTTPNGESHTLIHLPDQALQQMIATKKLADADEIDQSELTLETKEDGSVVYKTKVTNKRKILGFIPFNYESEVELNDADSEITSEPTDKSFIGQLLFRLSR